MEARVQINDTQLRHLKKFAESYCDNFYTVGNSKESKILYLCVAKVCQYIFQKARRNQLLNIINLSHRPAADPGFDFEYYAGGKIKIVPYYNFEDQYAYYSGPLNAADVIAIVAFDPSKKRGQVLLEASVNDYIRVGAMDAIDDNTRRIDVGAAHSAMNAERENKQ